MSNTISPEHLKNLGPVRVTIPVSVAYNLGSLQTGIANIMNHLGCQACCSGIDVTYQTEREFMLTEHLQVETRDAALGSQASLGRVTQIALPPRADIKAVQAAVLRAAGRVSHPGCCSGFDILFLNEVEGVQ